MLNVRRNNCMRGKQKSRKNCGVRVLPRMLWGSESLFWGNHTPKGDARAALIDLLPVDQRHWRAEARRTRAEQGGVKAGRTHDIRKTVCESDAEHM
jgi:hypothetical protein